MYDDFDDDDTGHPAPPPPPSRPGAVHPRWPPGALPPVTEQSDLIMSQQDTTMTQPSFGQSPPPRFPPQPSSWQPSVQQGSATPLASTAPLSPPGLELPPVPDSMQDIALSPATTDSSVRSRSRDYGTDLPWQPTLASPAPPHGAAQPWQPTIPPPAPPPEESPPSSATTTLYDNSPLPAAKPNGVHTPTQQPPGSQPEDTSSDRSRTRDYGSPPTVVVDSPLPVRRKVRFREDEPETAKESPLAQRTPATEASSSTSASSSSTKSCSLHPSVR